MTSRLHSIRDGRKIALDLYRSILRTHRTLPLEMRKLGDAYVRDEFKAHKKATPEQSMKFFGEWNNYLTLLRIQIREQQNREAEVQKRFTSTTPTTNKEVQVEKEEFLKTPIGLSLSQDKQQRLTDDQREKLRKLEEELIQDRLETISKAQQERNKATPSSSR